MKRPIRRLLAATAVTAGAVMLPTVVLAADDEVPPPQGLEIGADALFSIDATMLAADDEVPPPQGLETGADALFSIDATIVAIILGTLIPILNGVVTKLTTSSGVKAILTLALSTVAGLITTATTEGGDAVFSSSLVLNTALSFILAVATYVGLWKPLEVTSSPVTHVDENGVLVTEPGKLATVGVK